MANQADEFELHERTVSVSSSRTSGSFGDVANGDSWPGGAKAKFKSVAENLPFIDQTYLISRRTALAALLSLR
jgi:hypothetical protein